MRCPTREPLARHAVAATITDWVGYVRARETNPRRDSKYGGELYWRGRIDPSSVLSGRPEFRHSGVLRGTPASPGNAGSAGATGVARGFAVAGIVFSAVTTTIAIIAIIYRSVGG